MPCGSPLGRLPARGRADPLRSLAFLQPHARSASFASTKMTLASSSVR
jgi:hypothetical protein